MLGLSLIELLVVIAIVGLLAAIVWMGSRGLLERGRVNQAISLIELRANDARLEAKRNDREVEFRVDTDSVEIAEPGSSGRQFAFDSSVSAGWNGGRVLLFEPPFGTWSGAEMVIEVTSGRTTATVTFVGALARPVVTR